jgi:hypothetical protein
MAGLFAGNGYWTAFEGDWRELLARHRLGVLPFVSLQCREKVRSLLAIQAATS